MSDPVQSGGAGGSRMSTGIKLLVMGGAAAALLYTCAPAAGGVIRGTPSLLWFGNPFFRPPMAGPVRPGEEQQPGTGTSTTTRTGGGTHFVPIPRSSPDAPAGSTVTTHPGGTTPGGTSGGTPGGATGGDGTSARGGFGASGTAHGGGSAAS